MGVKQTLTEYTIDDVRNLSEILSRYANRYDELAKKMAQNSFKSLAVPNQKSMEDRVGILDSSRFSGNWRALRRYEFTPN